MHFNDWLKSLPGAPTPTTAAKTANLVDATVIRHARKGETTADNAIMIARAYGVSPIDALIDLGFLTMTDLEGRIVALEKKELREAAMEDLIEVLVEKVNASGLFEGTFDAKFIADPPSAVVESLPQVQSLFTDNDAP